jgi:hypothetical protein
MAGRISSNPTRNDVKAGTIRKNEYKWRYLKSPKLNKEMENIIPFNLYHYLLLIGF